MPNKKGVIKSEYEGESIRTLLVTNSGKIVVVSSVRVPTILNETWDYETMVFPGILKNYDAKVIIDLIKDYSELDCEKYSSYDELKQGHIEMCATWLRKK